MLNKDITIQETEHWLRETDETKLEQLWVAADAVRKQNVGDAVHLRGLIEVSNYCVRRCAYCGLAADNKDMTRYRMNADEIFACAEEATSYGYGTVVMPNVTPVEYRMKYEIYPGKACLNETA